ncbi:hypothetical protein G4177_34380 [Corallococcus sp. ZKHCc1 1396]|uniref:Uncharacterized protein n=1 Tax=Corallococcus soli TaxID=2710757 RepID=A0ABR9PZ92_9BACT|nr:hypothetical protein [Corallococcus soli]MBE4753250.1 hypothetical protein [Corallococcus soli]
MRRGLAVCVALGCWALSLWLALTWVRPGTAWGAEFSSDSAIPLLMARAPHVDLFAAYYWGQDRFGAWPFLLARYFGGRDWSAEGLQALLIVVTWTAAFPLARLARTGVVAVGLCLCVPLLVGLPREVRAHLLDISQPYGWQFAVMAWSWLGMRGVLEARTSRGAWGWGLAATAFCGLAFWISVSSLPSLVALLGVECLRARARGLAGWRRFAGAAVPLVVAGVFERQLRRLYHRFAGRTQGHEFRTTVSVDWGHLLENTRQVLSLMGAGPVPLGGALLVLLGAGAAWWPRQGRRGLAAWAELSGAAWLALGGGLASLAQLPLLVAVSHVRLNAYSPRYLALAHALALLGVAALVLGWLVARISERVLQAAGALATVALAGAVLRWPGPPEAREVHAQARDAAEALGRVAPGTLLMGGYWDVYRLTALQPLSAQAKPLPIPEDYQRTPFHIRAMKAARELSWIQRLEAGAEPGEVPLEQELHDVAFRRDPEPYLRSPGYAFWRYVRESPPPAGEASPTR